MKVHKTTSDRIYFQMDSGAYGSVLKSDVSKLAEAIELPNGYIDGRASECMVEINRANNPCPAETD